MINYLLEILQTNTINNQFTDLNDYFYYRDCDIYWKSTENRTLSYSYKHCSRSNNNNNKNFILNNPNNTHSHIIKDEILETTLDNISIFNSNNTNNNSYSNSGFISTNSNINNNNNNNINSISNLDLLNKANSSAPYFLENNSVLEALESFKPNWQVDKINNLIYEKYENNKDYYGSCNVESHASNFPSTNYNTSTASSTLNSTMNGYTYWSSYNNNLSFMQEPTKKDSLLDSLFDYSRIYEEFISKIGEPKSYLSVYKHIIIKEVIVFIQISVLGYEKIPKINIPYSTLINHFYRVVENSNTSIDYEILIAFIRIIKKYGEEITDEWSDIFKILNIIIRREENKNYDKLIKVLYEILDRIKLLIISQKFNGVLSEYISFLDEFKTFPYDSLMILKCKYKLNSFLNYVSKLESVIIENLIK